MNLVQNAGADSEKDEYKSLLRSLKIHI